jgi:hypothetical protein
MIVDGWQGEIPVFVEGLELFELYLGDDRDKILALRNASKTWMPRMNVNATPALATPGVPDLSSCHDRAGRSLRQDQPTSGLR